MNNKRTSREIIELWLEYLKQGKWSSMADLCQISWFKDYRDTAAIFIKNQYDFFAISSYKIIDENKNAQCLHKYTVEIDTQLGKRIMIANVICEIAPFKPSLDGKWGVNPISAILKNPGWKKNDYIVRKKRV